MKTVRDTVYYNTGNFLYLGAQWVISVMLVSMGGFRDAGYFSLAMTVSGVFGMVAAYGLRTFQISDINNRFSDNTYVVTRLITTLLSALCCAVYAFAAKYRGVAFLSIFGYMAYKGVEAYSDVLNGIWQKRGQMMAVGLSMGMKGVLNFVSFVTVYHLSENFPLAMTAMAAASALVLLSYDLPVTGRITEKAKHYKNADIGQILLLLRLGLLTMLFAVTSSIFNAVPRLVLEHRNGTALLGVFASVSSPTVLISTFAIGILLPVVPKMASYYRRKQSKQLLRLTAACDAVIVAIGLLACGGAYLFGKSVFGALFGEGILPYFSLIYPLIGASVLAALVSCRASLFIAARKLVALLLFSAFGCILLYVLSRVLIAAYGLNGATYAMLLSSAAVLITETVYIAALIMQTSRKKVRSAVVTGPTGAIGLALLNRLTAENVRVYAVLRPCSPRNAGIPDNALITKIECDLDDYDTLKEKIVKPVDAFFHLAWQGTSGAGRDDAALQEQNIAGALAAVEAAKALKCKVFVGAGSQAEYGRVDGVLKPDTPDNPETEYGKAKLLAGQKTRELCERYGIRHEWVRILSVYGPHDGENSMISSSLRKLRNGETPQYTKGEQIWDYLFEDDAANALFLVAENGRDGQDYVLGSGKGQPLSEYIKALHKAASANEPVFGEVPYNEKQIMHLVADIEELKKDTGFEPEVSFEEGIRRTVEMTL